MKLTALSLAPVLLAATASLSAQCITLNESETPWLPDPVLHDRVYKFVAPAAMTVTDFELYTHSVVTEGSTLFTRLYLQNGAGEPRNNAAAFGTLNFPNWNPGWFAANLTSQVSLDAGQEFYVGYQISHVTHRPEASSGTSTECWRRELGINTDWIRTTTDKFPMVRIHCLDTNGTDRTFGTGCQSAGGIPQSLALDTPNIGETVRIRGRRMPAGAAGSLFVGFEDDFMGGLPLPFELSLLQMPGCSIYTSSEVAVSFVTDAAGKATLDLAIDDDPNIIGMLVYFQHACVDPTANAFGIAWSEALEITIGW